MADLTVVNMIEIYRITDIVIVKSQCLLKLIIPNEISNNILVDD